MDNKKKRDQREEGEEKEGQEEQQDIFEEGYYHEIGQQKNPNDRSRPGSEADQEYP